MFIGGVHSNVTDVQVVLAVIAVKAVGGSGIVAGLVVIPNIELNILEPMIFFVATLKL